MKYYTPSWLDELCLAGEVAWTRLTPRRATPTSDTDDGEPAPPTTGTAAATRATPVTLAPRTALFDLVAAVRSTPNAPEPAIPEAGAGAEILALLQQRGALFFDELVGGTRRLATDVERGLRELIGAGLVTSDGFQGLREIAGGSKRNGRRHGRRSSSYLRGGLFAGGGPPGRWSPVEEPTSDDGSALDRADIEDLAEQVADVMLQRYGVVFRDLYPLEPFTVPWREVLRALRRLEARGIIRGGRFVTGFAGEQYALPEALTLLRKIRREPTTGQRITISAVDPANLTGVVLPGPRVPKQSGRSFDLVDGVIPATAAAHVVMLEEPALASAGGD